MKYFKDKIIDNDNDKVFAHILSLNILLSEIEQITPSKIYTKSDSDNKIPSVKLQTKNISIRPFHKHITKMQNLKFDPK